MDMRTLRRMSIEELRRAVRAKTLEMRLPRLQKQASRLSAQIRRAQSEASRLEVRIRQLLRGAPVPAGPRRRAKNRTSLRALMGQIVRKKPGLTAAEIAVEALRRGFKTTAKDTQTFKINAANVLRLNREFVKREGKYSLRK